MPDNGGPWVRAPAPGEPGAMTNRVQHVTIVGGGSAGWLTASILLALLNRRGERGIKVTVIESPRIPRVGVGEATTPTVADTLRNLDIDEKDFLRRVDGSFKCSVKFAGWNHNADGTPRDVYHPFFAPGPTHGFLPAYHYLKTAKTGYAEPFISAMTPGDVLFDEYRAPKTVDTPAFESVFTYAYHLDALKFADFLRDHAIALGCEFIPDDVVDVGLDARGFVSTLTLEQRGEVPVEFVVDCTGFRGLIIRDALEEPFVPFGHHLLCDRALAVNLPYKDGDGGRIDPFTTATALGAGWSWKIPLYSRRGLGYVFSSAHASDDDALREFMEFLGEKEPYPDARVIEMRVGRLRRSWVKNCVAIGLASGFVEPLESTALHVIQMAIRRLVEFFPDKAISPELADGYNRSIESLYEEVRDFICLHYAASSRRDTPFWRAVHEDAEVPETLARRLALWKRKLPDQHDTAGHTLFNYWSFIYVLMTKGYFDGVDFPLEGSVSAQDFREFQGVVQRARNGLMATLPDHRTYLDQIRQDATPPWQRPMPAPENQPTLGRLPATPPQTTFGRAH